MTQDHFYRPPASARRYFLLGFLLKMALLTSPPFAAADETSVIPASAALEIGISDQAFAVMQRVYHSDDTNPVAQHRNLFDAGVVYDLPEIETRIVTVYDPAKKQVMLIDRVAKNQTSITTEELVEFTANVKASSGNPSDLGIGTVARPSDRGEGYTAEFSTTDDGRHITVRYDVTTQPVNSHTMAKDFGRFSDLSSRLSLLRQRGLPPFARMSISRKLASLGVLPNATTLTIQRGDKTECYRSTTTLETFTQKDAEAINKVRGMLASYGKVTMSEFTTE